MTVYVYGNRAGMDTATTGTGTITLGSALTSYQSFADAGIADADIVNYLIEDGVAWEIGTGTYTASGTTLSRTVIESTNSDSAINLSGSANVYVIIPSSFATKNTIPIATVMDYAGTTAPALWLLCYGQNVSRTTYAELFGVISTTYGVGDGSTTFGIPDLRGRVVAGKDDMGGSSANRLTDQTGGLDGDVLGDSGGAETHTLTSAQLAAHTHTSGPATDYVGSGANGQLASQSGGADPKTATAMSTISTGSAGSDGAHNNVQPTFILNKIIFAGA